MGRVRTAYHFQNVPGELSTENVRGAYPTAENQVNFMQKIVSQLHHPIVPMLPIPSWEDQAVLLESMMLIR